MIPYISIHMQTCLFSDMCIHINVDSHMFSR